MRNDKDRAPAHQIMQGGLHQRFGLAIQSRSRLIQNQNGRIFQQGRAIASRWRSPPESRTPRSPMTVS